MNDGAPPPVTTLRQLYLTLFLRGRSSRGLQKDQAPKSVGDKLKGTLAIYALSGLIALTLTGHPPFALSLYLHGMTFFFLGMFVAATAGEILFNKDEAEILLHRPVDPRTLLWAKVGVLVRVSLWMATAFNLAGLLIGSFGKGGSWLFAPAHLLSSAVAALFCSGSVVLLYQACLRWFGREKLDNLMTTTQVLMAVVLVAGSQFVPHLLLGMEKSPEGIFNRWWIHLLPPAWFASLDEVLTGRGGGAHWIMAGTGVTVTAAVLALAFGKMAKAYEEGLQSLAESQPRKPRAAGKRRILDRLTEFPPLSWTLRDPIVKASFRLCSAYMLRDRDIKLRLYPGLVPVLMMPAVFLLRGSGDSGGEFGIAMAGGYLGLIPLMAMNLLQYSQSWQASDIYRLAPVPGPGPFIRGAMQAVALILVVPGVLVLLVVTFLLPGGPAHAAMLLPGLLALPVYARIPGAIEKAVPLSKPTEEAKAGMRGVVMFLMMISALIVPGIGIGAKMAGHFPLFLVIEVVLVGIVCYRLNLEISRKSWDALE
ncbi:hypothetical protein [Luteolibacter marinus]|uniref:hypothetical protein n=1 Tax=Luteolibacter marinus TaxID=2776705 RepID=UPI001868D746|nr:hypothetical protein [Luteolibacter marinus]